MNKRKISIGVIVLLIVGGVLFFFLKKPSGESVRLETAATERSTFSNVITATGTVEPVVEVEVGTQVSGIIDKLYVDYNSVVKKGQLLAEMDKVNLQAELASNQASLASSKTEFEYQEKNFSRSKVLYEKKLISDTDYETAVYNYERAKNSYEQSKANIIKVKRNLEYATILSPIDGVVINRAVEEGQTVAAGFSTPTLFTIANDLTQMRVIADVDEADIGTVEEGQNVKFSVDAYPDDVFEGAVTQVRLEAVVESNVVTYEVVISAYNPELKLKPGLTANVSIYTLERDNVLTIPTKALRFVPDVELLSEMGINVEGNSDAPSGKKIVWQKNGQTLVPKVITTGAVSGSLTEITEGLTDKEEVVVELKTVSKGTSTASAEKSPFMPSPPGGNNNRKSQSKE
ncbi:efflux RND transporter periplasmic adaptor subunit [Massilibacteroides sp.]|uniref:efflux RND transporter periplasmic adaptor subunit n=1 Tax=Massilibacteroides sp. TaxID=2034766 RepID=UPI002610F67F|nr:efflux RND transporter periplasmic adaptor subunit [Massilibacteroides sp.]MDD4514674.1 efflux RND transporter periplasmic adaptor subunit [Massilibacteroides sp.]